MTTAYRPTLLVGSSTIQGTRVELLVGHVPASPEGLGQCSECPEVPTPGSGSIAPGIVLVGYHSGALQISVTEAVCIACLPALTAALHGTGVAQVTVEIPTPCHGITNPEVARLHHERDVLIRRLAASSAVNGVGGVPWSDVIFWQQRFAYTDQTLRRIAAGDSPAPFDRIPVVVEEAW